jgi:hypothetical protein
MSSLPTVYFESLEELRANLGAHHVSLQIILAERSSDENQALITIFHNNVSIAMSLPRNLDDGTAGWMQHHFGNKHSDGEQ